MNYTKLDMAVAGALSLGFLSALATPGIVGEQVLGCVGVAVLLGSVIMRRPVRRSKPRSLPMVGVCQLEEHRRLIARQNASQARIKRVA